MLDWHFYQGVWREIPAWGKAYGALGTLFANHQGKGERLVVGLALPTRAYAAAFTALGFALEQVKTPIDQPAPDDHFLRLCELAPGSAVKYRDSTDDKLKDALFEGCREMRGELYIGIRKNSRHSIDWLPPQYATRVHPSSKVITQLPKSQKGRSVDKGSRLLRACIAETGIFDYYLHSRLECLFIGNKDALARELTKTPFAVRREDLCEGTLQDILRAQELLPDGEGYRTRILSDRSKQVSKERETPRLVLFDGAAGFLKWRDLWRDAHWLVVLDKAQSGFDEAVSALNREYRDNHLEGDPPNLSFLPQQLSAMAYKEARG